MMKLPENHPYHAAAKSFTTSFKGEIRSIYNKYASIVRSDTFLNRVLGSIKKLIERMAIDAVLKKTVSNAIQTPLAVANNAAVGNLLGDFSSCIVSAALFFYWKSRDKEDDELKKEITTFIGNFPSENQVEGFIAEVANYYLIRFLPAIELLTDARKGESVKYLAWFLTAIFTNYFMENEKLDIKNLEKILASSILETEGDALFKTILQTNKKLEYNDWTFEGLLLRAPILTLHGEFWVKNDDRSDKSLKYPPQIVDAQYAKEAGYQHRPIWVLPATSGDNLAPMDLINKALLNQYNANQSFEKSYENSLNDIKNQTFEMCKDEDGIFNNFKNGIDKLSSVLNLRNKDKIKEKKNHKENFISHFFDKQSNEKLRLELLDKRFQLVENLHTSSKNNLSEHVPSLLFHYVQALSHNILRIYIDNNRIPLLHECLFFIKETELIGEALSAIINDKQSNFEKSEKLKKLILFQNFLQKQKQCLLFSYCKENIFDYQVPIQTNVLEFSNSEINLMNYNNELIKIAPKINFQKQDIINLNEKLLSVVSQKNKKNIIKFQALGMDYIAITKKLLFYCAQCENNLDGSYSSSISPLLERFEKISDFTLFKDDRGLTPLHIAASCGNYQILKIFLAHIRKSEFKYLLLYACESRSLQKTPVIDLLIRYGFNVNVQNDDNDTPLHLLFRTAKQNRLSANNEAITIEVARTLLTNSAKVTLVNKQGKTSIDYLQEFSKGTTNQELISLRKLFAKQNKKEDRDNLRKLLKDKSVQLINKNNLNKYFKFFDLKKLPEIDRIHPLIKEIILNNASTMEYLDLSYANHFSAADMSQFISRCKNLKSLIIAKISTAFWHSLAVDLPQNDFESMNISDNLRLQDINITHNAQDTNRTIKILALEVHNNPWLVQVGFIGDYINRYHIKNNMRLNTVNINCKKIDDFHIEGIRNLSKINFNDCEILNLSFVGEFDYFDKILQSILPKIDKITKLDCSKVKNYDFKKKATEFCDVAAKQTHVDAALPYCNMALRLCPDDAYVNGRIGDCYYNLKNFDLSRRYFAHAISLKPNQAEYHFKCAQSFYELGKSDQATLHCKKACDLDPLNTKYNEFSDRLKNPKQSEHVVSTQKQSTWNPWSLFSNNNKQPGGEVRATVSNDTPNAQTADPNLSQK